MNIKLHTDFHNQPDITEFEQNFDAVTFAETVSGTGADSVNVFIKCNNGYCYFPTTVGTKYPFLKTDMLCDITKECHKRNIRVIGYINVALDYNLGINKPKLLREDKSGNRITEPRENPYSMQMCISGEYADSLILTVREAVENYSLDGIFADNLLPTACYCPACRAEMKKRNIDIDSEEAVSKFALENALSFARRLKSAIGDIPLEIKGLPYVNSTGVSDCAYIPVMPQTDGYDTYPVYASYLRNKYENCYFLTGRFLRGWGDFGGRRNPYSVLNDAGDSLIYGTSFCLGDHMDAVNGLDDKMYSSYSESFDLLKRCYKLIGDKKHCSEIAILVNRDFELTDDIKGAVRMMSELKIQFDIIDTDESFDKYSAIVITDSFNETENLECRLSSYNGSVIASGNGIFACRDFLSDKLDLNIGGIEENEEAYFDFEGTPSACYSHFVKIKDFNSVSRIILPRNETGVFTDRPIIYAPPMPNKSEYSAISVNDRFCAIAFDVFGAYSRYRSIEQLQSVKKIFDFLLPMRKIKATLPDTSRIALYEGGDKDIMFIKTTYPESGNTVSGTVFVKSGNTVCVSAKYLRAKIADSDKELEIAYSENQTEISLPEIDGFIGIELFR